MMLDKLRRQTARCLEGAAVHALHRSVSSAHGRRKGRASMPDGRRARAYIPSGLCVQTVVLFNGQEVEKWTFASGIFRTT